MINMTKGDIVYYAHIKPGTDSYDLYELKVRTIYENSFVAEDIKDKVSYLIDNSQLGETVFFSRNEAVNFIKH